MPHRSLACLALLVGLTLAARPPAVAADKPATRPDSTTVPADLPGFRTVATAAKAAVKPPAANTGAQLGYLGVSVRPADEKPAGGKAAGVVVETVDPHSPAAKAGVAVGDHVLRVNGTDVSRPADFAETLLAMAAGDPVKLLVRRGGAEQALATTLAPASKPLKLSGVRAVMGVTLKDAPDGDGAVVDRVSPDLPAGRAGMRPGDVILRINDEPVGATASMTELLAGHAPDDVVAVRYRRDGDVREARVKLAADARSGLDTRGFSPANVFRKDVYKLAVVAIEYPDVKRAEKVPAEAWEDALFSTGTYTTKSPTGQPVFGSVNDYYREVSVNRLRVEGKVFDWVTAAKNRADYGAGSGDRRLLNEAIDKVLERDGKDALKGFDGLLFLYAGGRMQTNRGNVYWPHKGFLLHQGRRHPYFICPEGGDRMTNISVFVHEFGHMLGLPDLYARPENPGSEGLGQWCLMSNQLGNGRPQHMSAWCKEQLGWLAPAVVDPTVKQKLVLSPIHGTSDQCFKVLARPDGSEYFLLEVRNKTGFDADLPGEGLLVWRVVRGRPILEESHGVDGPLGPRSYLRSVPFPTPSNRSFTPFTTPSSRPQLGGGWPVFITDIDRLPDGRVTFSVGYETY